MARHESPNHDSPATAQHHSTKPPLPPSGSEPNGKRQTVRVAKPTTKSPTAPNPRGQARTDKAPASAKQRTPLDGGHNVEVEQEEKPPRPLTSRSWRASGGDEGEPEEVDHAERSAMSAANAWAFIARRCR